MLDCGRTHTCEEISDWAKALQSVGKTLQAEKREVRRLRAVLRSIATVREISDADSTLYEIGTEANRALKRPKVVV